jgi:5-hydroxyisourate hydrolase
MSLSTHVLDTTHGTPARGMAVRLRSGETVLVDCLTDQEGRCGELKDLRLKAGKYRLEFEVAAYFETLGIVLAEPPFLDVIQIEFGMSELGGHYHVPLLVSPYGYSTYRGS